MAGTRWVAAALASLLVCGVSRAQAPARYLYVAQTAAPTSREGPVRAGLLIWTCADNECSISGPWSAPGVPACAALAAQVGRIVSYGRAGAMLSEAQLAHCNANLPAVQSLRLDPNLARQVRPLQPHPNLIAPVIGSNAMTPPSSEPTPTPTQLAVEPGSRLEDIRVFGLSGDTVSFHGVTPALSPSPLPAAISIAGGVIAPPALTLQASAPGAAPSPRSSVVPAPFYHRGTRGDVTMRVTISMRDLPSDALGLGINCMLSRARYVPPDTTTYADLGTLNANAEENEVAQGEVDVSIDNINRWDTTVDIPMQLRPFYRLQDARSYICAVYMNVDSLSSPGRDQIPIVSLVEPASPRPLYRAAPGTTPQLRLRGNIQ